MPARLIDLLVFASMGNISISIFYILSCFVIVFLAFFYFSKIFLKISNIPISVIAALFFTINPIFLGNASKIGLVLAAAMLPLCLITIQKTFEKQQFRYLLLWIACLNVSLIHPFTFTVNLLISGGYLIYMMFKNKTFISQNIPKLLLVGLVGLLLNAYFLLPLASLGSVNKDVLSSSVTSAPTDYTALIDVANTGDIFTGLALAKGVLKDYEFYDNNTQLLYFIGIFSFYVMLFGVYVRVEKKLSLPNRKYFALALAAFLILLLLAAVNYLFVKDLIKLVVNLPGGWIFRSPLKWQLYIPFTIATMLVIVLSYIPKKSHKIALYSGLTVSFLLMNSFISFDIYNKLLVSREISYFGALQQTKLSQKNLLIINDESCFSFASSNSPVMTELNQILTSKNVQVKQMGIDVADTINLGSFDFVLGCQDTAATALAGYDFDLQTTFVNDAFQLYTNSKPREYVYANQSLFALQEPQQIGNKYELATNTLGSNFDFVDAADHSTVTTRGLQDTYENVTFKDIQGSSISTNLSPPTNSGDQTLYLRNSDELYYSLADHTLSLTPEEKDGYQALDSSGKRQAIQIPHENKLAVRYDDSRYDSVNIFPNPSIEEGLWQEEVGDCYAYGDDARIRMVASTKDKTNGKQSLQLEATNHVACTGPASIPIEEEQTYLTSFDYKTVDGRFAAYYISFDDEAQTSFFKRLDDTQGEWDTVTKSIVAPAGARSMSILLYAYPDTSGVTTGMARYDNFQLTATPHLQNNFYLVSAPKKDLVAPKKVSYESVDPTKTIIHIKGARTAFYLETKESYSPRWNLSLKDGATIPEQGHLKINNFMNGWLVDPTTLCNTSCTKNDDGSYDLTLFMEFAPQRWLYIGAAITILTVLATAGYFIYDAKRPHTAKKYVMRRHR